MFGKRAKALGVSAARQDAPAGSTSLQNASFDGEDNGYDQSAGVGTQVRSMFTHTRRRGVQPRGVRLFGSTLLTAPEGSLWTRRGAVTALLTRPRSVASREPRPWGRSEYACARALGLRLPLYLPFSGGPTWPSHSSFAAHTYADQRPGRGQTK